MRFISSGVDIRQVRAARSVEKRRGCWILSLGLIFFSSILVADSVQHWAEVEAIFNRIHSNLKKSEQDMLAPNLELDPKAPFGCVIRKDGNSTVHLAVSPQYVQFLHAVTEASVATTKNKKHLSETLQKATFQADGVVLLLRQPDAGILNLKLDNYENLFLTKFNQIAGGILSIQTAHVCLHHNPQGAEPDSVTSAATRGLDVKQWKKVLEHGVTSAVSCAYNTESLCEFYEVLDTLQPRPEWVDHFLPRSVKGKKTAKDMYDLRKKLMR